MCDHQSKKQNSQQFFCRSKFRAVTHSSHGALLGTFEILSDTYQKFQFVAQRENKFPKCNAFFGHWLYPSFQSSPTPLEIENLIKILIPMQINSNSSIPLETEIKKSIPWNQSEP